MAGAASNFDAETIKKLLKQAEAKGTPLSFAYGHATSPEKCGLMLDMRKPGKAMSTVLKKSSKDIKRVCYGTFVGVDGEMHLKPEKPIKGMIRLLVKRFRSEGLRKYLPMLVDVDGQVIDEDTLPDTEGDDAAPAPSTMGTSDLEVLKPKLLAAKKQVDAIALADAGQLPNQMTEALKHYKNGNAQGVVETLGLIARDLKAHAATAQPPEAQVSAKEEAALKQLQQLLPKAITRLKALPERAQ